jgi:hypothetical protein
MTAKEEEILVHRVLFEMSKNIAKAYYVPDILGNDQITPVLNRLKAEGLVEVPNIVNPYIVRLMPSGVDIVRHADGYIGFKQEQLLQKQRNEQAQLKKDKLEQNAAKATISAARAAWVAGIASLISIIVSIYALWQSNEVDKVKAELKLLQKQVRVSTKLRQ